ASGRAAGRRARCRRPPRRGATLAEPEQAGKGGVFAQAGEVGVVERVYAVLGVELDRELEELGGLFRFALQGVDRGGEVGEALVLALPTAAGADLERLVELAAVLVHHGEKEGILVREVLV